MALKFGNTNVLACSFVMFLVWFKVLSSNSGLMIREARMGKSFFKNFDVLVQLLSTDVMVIWRIVQKALVRCQ